MDGAPLLGLFSLCLFGSAFCLFWGQLLIGKLLLPVWGGSPLVWNTCLAFFQLVLGLGYLWADRVRRWFAPRFAVLIHGVLLLAGLSLLPFRLGISEGVPVGIQSPLLALWVQLTLAVGGPMLLLSATTPLLQHWFSLRDPSPQATRDPYVLYVASNAGSLAGLLAYPLLLEPGLPLAWQTRLWGIAYGLLCGLVLLCGGGTVLGQRFSGLQLSSKSSCLSSAWQSASSQSSEQQAKSNLQAAVARDDAYFFSDREAQNPQDQVLPRSTSSGGDPWCWAALAFIPAGLLVAVTTLLTTDVAPVPLLWAIPLAIYLLTFMLAFAGYDLSRVGAGGAALLACLAVGVQALGLVKPLLLLLPLHLTAFGLVCWGCHSELVQRRPVAEHLTQFYLWLALGGGLGGMFAALLAAQVFDNLLEYPLLLVLSLGVMSARGGGMGLWLGLGLILPLLMVRFQFQEWLHIGSGVGLGLGLGWLWVMTPRVARRAMTSRETFTRQISGEISGSKTSDWEQAATWGVMILGMVLLFGQPWLKPGLEVIHRERNAFGLNRIVDFHTEVGSFRSLLHGTTLHGSQNLDPEKASEPLTYFSRSGPVGQVFAQFRQQFQDAHPEIAVLGLGIGTLAAYAQPGDTWTFFELDPAIERLARTYFTYLRLTHPKVILGDARLALAQIPDGSYDLMVMDAFSSDAVPVHLLTQEALTLYLNKLKPQGGLLFNITNRHLNLAPVLAGLAGQLHLQAWQQAQTKLSLAEQQAGLAPSHWVLMTAAPTQWRMQDPWQPLLPQAGDPIWQDDFSNLLQVMRWPWPGNRDPSLEGIA
ncbi:MAG: fused MFS/spermidine synthase [Cyanobacteriota bacterium]